MSAPGPSSIPTSADPRTRRPTKKRALSPSTAHAASLAALFAKPDQDIVVPPPSSSQPPQRPRHLPPEIVSNVQGSSAGAGSGEFHVYKASRRREYERLRQMDEDLKRSQEQEQFARDRAEKLRADEERTRRNRERREKMKARKARGKTNTTTTTTTTTIAAAATAASAAPSAMPAHQERTPAEGRARTSEEPRHQDGDTRSGNRPRGDADDASPAAPAVGLVIHDDD